MDVGQGLGRDGAGAQAIWRHDRTARGVDPVHQRVRPDRRRIRPAAAEIGRRFRMADPARALAAEPRGTRDAAPSEPAYLEFRNLTKVYATGDGPVRALDQISV